MVVELRAQQIVIDAPRRDRDPFVAITVQRLIWSDDKTEIIQRINREKVINRALSSVATTVYPYYDLVTDKVNTISGAGLGVAIASAVSFWIMEEYAAEGAHLVNGQVFLDGNN